MSAPDLAELVLAVPEPPERRRGVRVALLAAAGATLAGAIGVLVWGGVAATPVQVKAASAVTANAGVQRFTTAGGYTLRAPKREGFGVLSPETAAASAVGGAVIALGPATPVGAAQTYAASAVRAHGWSSANFSCLVALWNRESGWNTHAGNADGAYGIPQALPGSKMGAGGGDWVNSAQVQIDWGLGYIAGRYGTPCAAWANSEATGYY